MYNIPDDFEERALFYLKQMKYYLENNYKYKDSDTRYKEYEQTELIFNSFINLYGNSNFKILNKTYLETSKKLPYLLGRNIFYWNEYLRYFNWKITF